MQRCRAEQSAASIAKAGGKWESRGVRYQAHTAPNPDSGYVSYAFKTIRVWLTGCCALKASPPGATIF